MVCTKWARGGGKSGGVRGMGAKGWSKGAIGVECIFLMKFSVKQLEH